MFHDILVFIPNGALSSVQKKRLEDASPGSIFHYLEADELSSCDMELFDAAIGGVPPEWIKKARNLKWLQLTSAGANRYLEPGLLPEGAFLTCSTGAYGKAVSEHGFAMLLALQKKLHRYRDQQRRGEWADLGPVVSLSHCTVLVVGFGDIGKSFAHLAKAFGARVIGVRRSAGGTFEDADEVSTIQDLDSLLPRADVVVLALPGTKDTFRLMDGEKFRLMKPGAVLINLGRGTSVVMDDLCRAVETGQIGAAGLDVTDPEPLPPDHRAWGIDNILITPHISGGFHLADTLDNIIGICVSNLKRLERGERPLSVVDLSLGYAERKNDI